MILEGCAVVTLKDAFLFTDGRYFLQAEKQLDRSLDFPFGVIADHDEHISK
jgi:hypothetical protein